MEVEHNVQNMVDDYDGQVRLVNETRQVSSTGCVLAIPPSGRQPDMVGAVYETRAQGQEPTLGTIGTPQSQEILYSDQNYKR